MVIKQLVAILSQNNCIRICQYSILIYNDFRFYIICTAEFISQWNSDFSQNIITTYKCNQFQNYIYHKIE